jgi:hypothetical protein
MVMMAAPSAVIFTIVLLLLCKDVLVDHERPIVQGACVHVGTVTDYHGAPEVACHKPSGGAAEVTDEGDEVAHLVSCLESSRKGMMKAS